MPRKDLARGKKGDPLMVDLNCPSCSRPASHHEDAHRAYDDTMKCRLDAAFIRKVGTMSPKDLHGGSGITTDHECPNPDHDPDVKVFGACSTCGSRKKLKKGWES